MFFKFVISFRFLCQNFVCISLLTQMCHKTRPYHSSCFNSPKSSSYAAPPYAVSFVTPLFPSKTYTYSCATHYRTHPACVLLYYERPDFTEIYRNSRSGDEHNTETLALSLKQSTFSHRMSWISVFNIFHPFTQKLPKSLCRSKFSN